MKQKFTRGNCFQLGMFYQIFTPSPSANFLNRAVECFSKRLTPLPCIRGSSTWKCSSVRRANPEKRLSVSNDFTAKLIN